jgi:hypothetical protein
VGFLLCEFNVALAEDVACRISPSISVRLMANTHPFCFPAAVGVHAFLKSVAPTEDLVGVELWEVGHCFSRGSKNCLDTWVLDAESIDQRVHHHNYCGVSRVDPSFVGWPGILWGHWGGGGCPLLICFGPPPCLGLRLAAFVAGGVCVFLAVVGVVRRWCRGWFQALGKLSLINGYWKRMSYRMSLSRDVGNLGVPSAKYCLRSPFPR